MKKLLKQRISKDLAKYLAEIGTKGGSIKSEKKAEAVKANGKLGGRPKAFNIRVTKNQFELITSALYEYSHRCSDDASYDDGTNSPELMKVSKSLDKVLSSLLKQEGKLK